MNFAPANIRTQPCDTPSSEQALRNLAEDFPRVSGRILALIFYSYSVRLGSIEAAVAATRDRLMDACLVAA
jgi:hypothetical protein